MSQFNVKYPTERLLFAFFNIVGPIYRAATVAPIVNKTN